MYFEELKLGMAVDLAPVVIEKEPMMEFARGAYKVKQAGTIFLTANPFETVLHPEADTHNFICPDVDESLFYRHLAKPAQTRAD